MEEPVSEDKIHAIQNIHESADVKAALVKEGYDSSIKIFHKPKHEFIKEVSGIMSEEEARKVYDRAKLNYIILTNFVVAHGSTYASEAYMSLSSRFDKTPSQNLFENTPSYQEIFGNLNYCDCPHCKSIFGPAAYFTDLMRIVKKYIELEEKKAISISERRPDLFEMKLSCENTNNEKPYLQIVNEIIESYIKEPNQTKENLYKNLYTKYYPFNLPFSLPSEKLRAKFQKSGLKTEAFLKAWNISQETTAAESMSITPELFTLLQKPLSADNLKKFYGLNDLASLSKLSEFLKVVGLTIRELNDILLQDIDESDNKNELLHNLFINQGLKENEFIEADHEKDLIKNLDAGGALERICRFIRLARILNLGYAETDWLLKVAGTDLNGNIPLLAVWNIYSFAKKAGFDIYTASALMGEIKSYGCNPFEQIFKHTRKELNTLSVPDIEQILAKELRVDIYSLRELRKYLKHEDSIDIDEIYRHCKTAGFMSLDIEAYITLLELLFENTLKVFTPADAELLFKTKINSRFNVLEMDYIINGKLSDDKLNPQLSLGFTLDDFYKKIEVLRKEYNADDDDEQALVNGIYAELANFFGYSMPEILSLFSCVLNEDGLKKFPFEILKKDESAIKEVKDTINKFSKYLLIIKAGISIDLISNAVKNKNCFELNLEKMTVQNLTDLSIFQTFFELFQDDSRKLLSFADEYANNILNTKILSEITGWNQTKLDDILNSLYPEAAMKPKNVVNLICKSDECMNLQSKLSLDKDSINILLSIFKNPKASYDNFAVNVEKFCGYADSELKMNVEAKKRDAILPLAMLKLREKYADINDYNKLYKYFLIDVEMDDKTTISPVKEGINALQLYLQRCRMNFEPGIKEIDIKEPWWSWMMDYRMWEANRKIFVYPENYLLPSVRQSKTQLFKDVEDALCQSKITDGYIEEQYVKYLDDYFQLTQLKICGAYETTNVDGLNVLYLFARSKQSPYTYYYCEQVSVLAWSEWKKIDTNIDCENITPVFVFNRLHIFWSTITENAKANIETATAGQINAGNQKAYTLQIKYTYLNLQGKWIAPQTLSENIVVLTEDDKQDKTAKSIRENVKNFGITISDGSFNKLTLLKLNRKNFDGFIEKDKDYECLAVITGSFSQNLGQIIKQIGNSTLDKEQAEFTETLNRIIKSNNFQSDNSGDGYFPTGYFKIFNEDLEEETIRYKNEFYVIDGYIPSKYSPMYTVLHDEIHHAIGVYLSQNILRNSVLPAKGILPYKNNIDSPNRPKLDINSFVIFDSKRKKAISSDDSAKIFDKLKKEGFIKDNFANEKRLSNMDISYYLSDILTDKNKRYIIEIQQILFKNIGAVYLFEKAENAQVIPVINQPGKFIYDCGDEAFLLYPVYIKEQSKSDYISLDIQKADAGISVGIPITVYTFTKLGFNKKESEQIFDKLKSSGLVSLRDKNDTYGTVNLNNCTRLKLGMELDKIVIEEKTLDMIFVNLMNLPFISKSDIALNPEVNVEAIIKILKDEKVLYEIKNKIYRVDLSMLKQKNHVLFTNSGNGILNEQSVSDVYKKLESAVSSITLNYRINSDLPDAFKRANFKDWKFGVQRLTNPTLKKLKRKLETGGIKSFLNRKTQSEPNPPIMPFSRLNPSGNVIKPKASDGAQIDFEGLYAEYNWELFYHIPLVIAKSFGTNAMYEESMRWFHFIFNPTKSNEEVEKSYWNFIPFVQSDNPTLEEILDDETGKAAIQAYNDSPFNPHAIARLRVGAYGKYTVMEYVDNIIQWADSQFILNTWESLTTATMLYVWANDLLGPKPQAVSKFERKEDKSFNEISEQGDVPQFIIDLEKKVQELSIDIDSIRVSDEVPFNDIHAYFGVPENDQILRMWDVVEDRLFKIRNSLDINGAPRITSLFENPIDPMALAKAAAAAGFSSPSELNRKPTLYPYRFSYMIEQAKSLTSQLVQLGNSIMNALEKNDSELLLITVNSQEQSVLNMTTSIKENQLNDIGTNIEALKILKESAQARQDFYKQNADEYMSPKEIVSMATGTAAAALQAVGGAAKFAAGVAHLVPQVGSPFAMKYGGAEIGSSLAGFAEGYNTMAGIMSFVSGQTLTMAQYDRRRDEWELQKKISEKEVKNIDKQLEAAMSQQKSAKRELEIHLKTIEHKTEVLNYLKKKFTGAQLYQWLIGKLSSTMWQTYQLALELAVSAQDAYQFERDEADTFIKFDYWDNGFRGLMSGEQLMFALEQMQQSYQKKNSRRLEIEKNISMLHTFPEVLKTLKEKGKCEFELNEKIFAQDYPGAYRRKIASIALSVPAVLPPYETIKATLKQIKSQILLKASKDGIAYLFEPSEEKPAADILKDASRHGEKIAVSNGINDSGMFSLSFNDERYLPFEGTGVNSSWTLEMPKECNNFDFSTITDIIITIKYTALEDEKRGEKSFYNDVLSLLKTK